MQLLKVTAKRSGTALRPQSREIAGEAPDDPRYWDRVCDLILARMKQDGIIPAQDNDTATLSPGQGNPVQKEVRKVV